VSLTHILEDIIADVLMRVGLWLIKQIASNAGAEDLTYLLTERMSHGRVAALGTLVRSVWAAVADRALCIDLALASISGRMMREASMRVAVEQEALLFFLGSTFVVAFFLMIMDRFGYTLLHGMVRPVSPSQFAVTTYGLYCISVLFAARRARRILERPSGAVSDPRVLLSIVFASGGVLSLIELLRTGNLGIAYCLLTTAMGFIIAKGGALFSDCVGHMSRACYLSLWRSGGRPLTRQDIRKELPLINRNQFERRGHRPRLARW
jgi:hypothetical protein